MAFGLKLDPAQKQVLVKSSLGAFAGFTVAEIIAELGTKALNLQGNTKVFAGMIIKLIIGMVLLSLSASGKLGGMFGTVAGYAAIGSIGFDLMSLAGFAGGATGIARSVGSKVRSVGRAASVSTQTSPSISVNVVRGGATNVSSSGSSSMLDMTGQP